MARFHHGHRSFWSHAVFIKPEQSFINWIGSLFFRKHPPWEQRNKTIVVLWAVAVGLLVGGACVVVILIQNGRH
jgi:hypothetical protein